MSDLDAEAARRTDERFERTRPFGGRTPPPVDTRGLPPGPRWPVLAAERRAAALPPPVRAVDAPAVRRRLHRPARSRGAGRWCCSPGRSTRRRSSPATPAVFHAGKGNAILGPIMGEHSLLLQDGGEHKRARKLLMPAFNGQALKRLPAVWSSEVAAGRGRPLARRARTFRSARPDERADPRGDPARRLRGHRRVPARRAAPARQRAPSTSARPSCSAGASRRCSASVRGGRPSTTPRELDRADVPPRSASAGRPPTCDERTDVLSRLIAGGDEQ